MKNTKSLKKAFDFRKTLNYGKYSKGKYVAVYVLEKRKYEDKSTNLFGICVSKKHGNSVVRNKLKRWAREAYTHLESRIKKGYFIIVLYKKDFKEYFGKGEVTFVDIENEILEQLAKIDMIGDN